MLPLIFVPEEWMSRISDVVQWGAPPQRVSIQWSAGQIQKLREMANRAAPLRSPVDDKVAVAILLCVDGQFAEAEANISRLIQENTDLIKRDGETFISVMFALYVLQQFGPLAALLHDRFGFNGEFSIDADEGGPGIGRVRWEISTAGVHRFVFDAKSYAYDKTRDDILAFYWAFPMYANFSFSKHSEYGTVIINQMDIGHTPGLCWSDNRPDYFLVPDCIFIPTRGYEWARHILTENLVPWVEKRDVAFWRGGTTGIPRVQGDWRTLERVELCEIARRYEHLGFLDIGLSSVLQIADPVQVDEVRNSGLVRGSVPWEQWGQFKYLIDIDGNSSPWSNLYQRLLTGSVVLKVESSRGLNQWYYDELKPWVNYVPVAPDMSDLIDKIQWLRANEGLARAVGQAGRDLAMSLTYERELGRSAGTIARCFQYFRGETSSAGPFGRDRVGNNGTSDSQRLVKVQELAGQQGNWDIVLGIAEHMRISGITSAQSYSVIFDAFLNLGRFDEARDTLEQAQVLFPTSLWIAVKRARLATVQRDYKVAAERWISVLQHDPMISECYSMGAFCFQEADDEDAALRLLRDGMKSLPRSIDIWIKYVELAMKCLGVLAARSCWTERREDFSDDHRTSLLGARIAMLEGDLPEATSLLEISVKLNNGSKTEGHHRFGQELEAAKLKSIMMQFESLGGRLEGCEFGSVQRAYGANPLGLLRWSTMWPAALIDGLENQFEGVGEPENTIIYPPTRPDDDWMTEDSRYGMKMHTFQRDSYSQAAAEVFFRKSCRRLTFLKEKLLRDLIEGQKIFVFKITNTTLTQDELDRLYIALQRYGPNNLLYVRLADAKNKAGTVQIIKPRLMVGYIKQFSFDFGENPQYFGVIPENWLPLVRSAHEIVTKNSLPWNPGR